jgi:hypothetical protein
MARNTVSLARAGYDMQNLEAAAVILADITKFGGEGSGAVQWARLVVERLTQHGGGDVGPWFERWSE